MAKSIQKITTRGVESLNLSATVLNTLFSKAVEYKEKSPFISFQPKGSGVEVTNGNGRFLGNQNSFLPEKIWIIFDDYGDRLVATALLPSEY